MVRTVEEGNLDVNNIEARKHAGEHCTLDACFDGVEVFLGNSAADNIVDEFEALLGIRLNPDLDMTVLTLTAGLTRILGIRLGSLGDGLAVSNLGLTDISFNSKLAQHSVDDYLKVKLTHTGYDSLACLFIRVALEGGVFLSELCKSDAHLLLTCFGLGLDGNSDNGLGEFHGFKYDGMFRVAERVARGGLLNTDAGRDITRIAAVDILSVVGVHLQNSAHTLVGVLGRVINGAACFDFTGIYSEEAELADKRVGSYLECESGERLVIGRMSELLLVSLGVDALDRGNIRGGGHIINNCIKQKLNALIAVGSTADDGHHVICKSRLSDAGLDLINGELLAVEIFLKQLVILLGNVLDHLGMVLLGKLLHVVGDIGNLDINAQVVFVVIGLHYNKVYDTFEIRLSADGQLNGDRIALKALFHHVDDSVEVSAHNVHLVNIDHSGNMILIRLSPDRLGLGLDAALSAKNCNRTVKNSQGALDLPYKTGYARLW